MNCTEAQCRFEPFCRKEATAVEAEFIAHIKQCEACSHAYSVWGRIASELKQAPLPTPPDGFEDRILAAVQNEKSSPRNKRAAIYHFPVRLAWAAALVLSIIGIFALQRFGHRPELVASSPATMTRTVHFSLSATSAVTVAIVGDFNEWNIEKNPMRQSETGTWNIDLPLASGSYQYLFYINGKEWKPDPSNAHQTPDGFGGINSEISL